MALLWSKVAALEKSQNTSTPSRSATWTGSRRVQPSVRNTEGGRAPVFQRLGTIVKVDRFGRAHIVQPRQASSQGQQARTESGQHEERSENSATASSAGTPDVRHPEEATRGQSWRMERGRGVKNAQDRSVVQGGHHHHSRSMDHGGGRHLSWSMDRQGVRNDGPTGSQYAAARAPSVPRPTARDNGAQEREQPTRRHVSERSKIHLNEPAPPQQTRVPAERIYGEYRTVDNQPCRTHLEARLERARQSPFIADIVSAVPPASFRFPKITKYEPTTDAVHHVQQYRQIADLYGYSDAIMCRTFSMSLGTVGLLWYGQLDQGSISDFDELARAFTSRFVTSIVQPKTIDALINMKRGSDETLKDYIARYWETYSVVEGCDQRVAATSFKIGLNDQSDLFQELTLRPPRHMDDLMATIDKFRELEELIASRAEKGSGSKPAVKEDPS